MSERFSFGEEKVAAVGEVELAYQQMGDPDGEPMLMIMGLGAQMIYWPDGFCAMLAERGFHLTRFDNRDAGRSSQIVAPDAPSVIAAFGGDRGRIPYTLEDMAADAAGLLDLLGIERAHVVGASLGGMIAQTLSFRHPDRVLSLCSIMSNTGSPDSGQPHESAMAALMTPLPIDTREHFVEGFLAARRAIGSTGFEIDEDALRKLAERCFERGVHVDGTARQFLAIIASGNRTEALRGTSPAAARRRPRFPAPSCSSSRAWDMTSRAASGRRSSARSWRTRSALARLHRAASSDTLAAMRRGGLWAFSSRRRRR